jgi:diphosphoinositol-polyphosphate diphosphatase
MPQDEMLGIFPFNSGKPSRGNGAGNGRCAAHMFVMHVEEELSSWPEQSERRRVWVRTSVALNSVLIAYSSFFVHRYDLQWCQ